MDGERMRAKRTACHGICFYFTAIIRTNKYKYHIVCDWKSILLIPFKHLYKWLEKAKKKHGTGLMTSRSSKKSSAYKFQLKESSTTCRDFDSFFFLLLPLLASKTVTWPFNDHLCVEQHTAQRDCARNWGNCMRRNWVAFASFLAHPSDRDFSCRSQSMLLRVIFYFEGWIIPALCLLRSSSPLLLILIEWT